MRHRPTPAAFFADRAFSAGRGHDPLRPRRSDRARRRRHLRRSVWSRVSGLVARLAGRSLDLDAAASRTPLAPVVVGRRCSAKTAFLAVGLLPLACQPAAASYTKECGARLLRNSPIWEHDYQSGALVQMKGVLRKDRWVMLYAQKQIGPKLWVYEKRGAVLDRADLSISDPCLSILPLKGNEHWEWDDPYPSR